MELTCIEEALSRICKEELEAYYQKHSRQDTLEHFKISGFTFNKLKSIFQIKKVQSIKEREINLDLISFQIYLKNHDVQSTAAHFGLSRHATEEIIKRNNLQLPDRPSYVTYPTIRQSITDEELMKLLNKYNNVDVMKLLNISETTLRKLFKDLNFKRRESIKDAISRINVNELQHYYLEHNHQETQEYFHLSSWMLDYIIKKYALRKDPEIANQQVKRTKFKRYGDANYNNLIQGKITTYQRYGSLQNLSHPQDSGPNKAFEKLLRNAGITYTREFPLDRTPYDFKIGNTLVEIDPTATHNVDWSPYGDHVGKTINYHKKKSEKARSMGYNCVHVFDWDTKSKIIGLLKQKELISADDCVIRSVSYVEALSFRKTFDLNVPRQIMNNYLLYGLVYNDELVQLLSISKKRNRYNIDSLCTDFRYLIQSGADKLFQYFIDINHPLQVTFTCDYNKFPDNPFRKISPTLVRERKFSKWVVPLTSHRMVRVYGDKQDIFTWNFKDYADI